MFESMPLFPPLRYPYSSPFLFSSFLKAHKVSLFPPKSLFYPSFMNSLIVKKKKRRRKDSIIPYHNSIIKSDSKDYSLIGEPQQINATNSFCRVMIIVSFCAQVYLLWLAANDYS